VSSDDERISYLAGEPVGELDAEERAALDEFRALLADPSLWVEPDADVEDRVVAAIAGEAATEPTVRSIDAAPSRRRRGPVGRFGPLVAAIAAAAIVVVAVAVLRQSDDDGVMLALQPTQLFPEARGTAEIFSEVSGLRIELDATGLPRRDGGLFYQAWLRDAAGNLVPIGTFHDGEKVTLWAGVSLADFPTLTITEEQSDNDQASSGRRVLVGTIEN
jgi:hypothetical protein